MGFGRASNSADVPSSDTPVCLDQSAAQPQRTCVGCRGKGCRSSLLRIALDMQGIALVFDESKTMPGRGAWLHPRRDCLEKAMTRRAWGRALKAHGAVNTADVQQVLMEHLSIASSPDDTDRESQTAVPHEDDRKRV